MIIVIVAMVLIVSVIVIQNREPRLWTAPKDSGCGDSSDSSASGLENPPPHRHEAVGWVAMRHSELPTAIPKPKGRRFQNEPKAAEIGKPPTPKDPPQGP